MNKKAVALVQYGEAVMAGGVIRFFLKPVYSGTENLNSLVALWKQHRRSIVLISNHINAYDPLYISAALSRILGSQLYPVWLPAKKRFFSNPLKRLLMGYHGCLPVGVGRDEDSLRSMRDVIEKVRAGDAICVFPEGQVSRDGSMGPDMGFVTFLARRSDLIVQPVRLSGIMGFRNDWKQILGRRRRLKMVFGKPAIIEKGNAVDSMELIRGASMD